MPTTQRTRTTAPTPSATCGSTVVGSRRLTACSVILTAQAPNKSPAEVEPRPVAHHATKNPIKSKTWNNKENEPNLGRTGKQNKPADEQEEELKKRCSRQPETALPTSAFTAKPRAR